MWTKWFELRSKIRGTVLKNEKHYKKIIYQRALDKQNKEANLFVIITQNELRRKAHETKHYVYRLRKNIQSRIEFKASQIKDYRPSLDAEIIYYCNIARQFGVEKNEILGAKPLNLSWKKYQDDHYRKQQLYKEWDDIVKDYNPDTAEAAS